MFKICLTGGPCSGKTDILNMLSRAIRRKGYEVFIIPETATELILNGIKVNSNISPVVFQNFVIDKQLAKEELYDNLKKYYDNDKLVIICDRGILDGYAYVGKTAFNEILKQKNLSVDETYKHYDAVFHLVTTANGAEEFYQWNNQRMKESCNNLARSETPEEARLKDQETIDVWSKHPNFYMFDNSTDFEGKAERVIKKVFQLLENYNKKNNIERNFIK